MSSLGRSVGIEPKAFGLGGVARTLREIFASPQFWDGMKIFAIGVALSGGRGIANSILEHIRKCFFAQAIFRHQDDSFRWAMHYITNTGRWSSTSRDVEISARPRLLLPNEGESDVSAANGPYQEGHGDGVHYFPLENETFRFKFQGVHVWASRQRQLVGDGAWDETLRLSFLSISTAPIRDFVSTAKSSYEELERGNVAVYAPDKYGLWSRSGSRSKRPSDSVHLPANMKERVLKDAKDFTSPANRRWYADRGIPYRRGYLFHGTPGSGKTSLVHVLASELDLPIYSLSLSSRNMDDAKFRELTADVPSYSLMLIEDIDSVFNQRTSTKDESSSQPLVSFSTLLNTLDGVGAPEGRILVMTTNFHDRLDPALIRPGRIDVQIQFDHASRTQARELFRRWYPASSSSKDQHPHHHSHQSQSQSQSQSRNQRDPLSESKSASLETKSTAPPSHASKASKDIDIDIDIDKLATQFANSVPEKTLSVAALQGYLLHHKSDPRRAVRAVGAWISNVAGGGADGDAGQ